MKRHVHISRNKTAEAVCAVLLICMITIIAAPMLLQYFPRAGETVYAVYGMSCHQMQERCFQLMGNPFPVCHRCCGFWIGMLAIALFACFTKHMSRKTALMLVFVMIADWFLASRGMIPDITAERLLTGIAGGAGSAELIRRFMKSISIPLEYKPVALFNRINH